MKAQVRHVGTYFRVQSCDSVIRRLIYSFLRRIDVSSNEIIRAICASDLYHCSKIRRSLLSKLYLNSMFDTGVT